MAFEYDEKDLEILRVMDRNARLSYREIAKALKMHPNTVMERVKRMEKEGVIERYAPVVNYQKLNCNILAIVQIDIEGKADSVVKSIASIGYVHSAYKTTGEYDAIAMVRCMDMDVFGRVLNAISDVPGVRRTNTKLVLKQFGRNGRFEL